MEVYFNLWKEQYSILREKHQNDVPLAEELRPLFHQSANNVKFKEELNNKAASINLALDTGLRYQSLINDLYVWIEELFEDFIERISAKQAGVIATLTDKWCSNLLHVIGETLDPYIVDSIDNQDGNFEIIIKILEYFEQRVPDYKLSIEDRILEGELPKSSTKPQKQPVRKKASRTQCIEDFIADKEHIPESISLLKKYLQGTSGIDAAKRIKAAEKAGLITGKPSITTVKASLGVQGGKTAYNEGYNTLNKEDYEDLIQLFRLK